MKVNPIIIIYMRTTGGPGIIALYRGFYYHFITIHTKGRNFQDHSGKFVSVKVNPIIMMPMQKAGGHGIIALYGGFDHHFLTMHTKRDTISEPFREMGISEN